MPEGVGWGFQVAENCREVLIFKEVEEKEFRLQETEQVTCCQLNMTTNSSEYLTSKCVVFHNSLSLDSFKTNFDHMIWDKGVKLNFEDFSSLDSKWLFS